MDSFYHEMTKKNIGVYTVEEQTKLLNSKVINEYKSVTTERHLKDINPHLITNFHTQRVTEENVDDLISGHHLVLEALDDMPSRIVVHRAAKRHGMPSIAMSGSPPHRGFVSSFLPDGIAYEDALNIQTKGKKISDPAVTAFIQDIKKKRALYSVTRGAPQEWADNFCNGKAGWIITPVRATLIAALCFHEATQILIGKNPLAIAPKGIIIDLDNLTQPVTVESPQKGYWEAFEL